MFFCSLVLLITNKLDFLKLLNNLKEIKFNYLILFLLVCLTIPFIQAKRWQILSNENLEKSLNTIIYAHAGSASTNIPLSNEIIKFFRLKKENAISKKIKLLLIDKLLSIKSKLLIFLPLLYIFINHEIKFEYKELFVFFYFLYFLLSVVFFKKYVRIFLLSILINFLILTSYYFIGLSLNLSEGIFFYSIYLIIELFTQIAGIWGTREFLSVYVMEYFNISSDVSFLIALFFSFGNILILLILLSRSFIKKLLIS